jgi:single-strand DNA-binding protein
MNHITLIGRLGKDPETKFLESGKQVTHFSVATDAGKDRDPDWHRVVCWDKTADIAARYLSKGRQVAIEGRMSYRQFEGKAGEKVTIAEVVCSRLHLIGDKAKGDGDESTPF